MTDGLVFVIQIGLVALVLLMAYRMFSLVRAAPLPESGSNQELGPAPFIGKQTTQPVTSSDRTELFTRLHILAGLQERDCRVNGLDLAKAPEAVRDYAAVWLYGAACALCDRSTRHSDSLAGLAAHIAQRKIGIRQPQALQAIATLSQSSALLACYRGGLEGAEFWRQHHYVTPASSLYEAITANAFI
ncbi:hypothetical protein QQF73_09500 [Marinobacter sp. M216]|uniref:Uncharacterized protein n=1 Tax=Marinobacter albus TaxID=3030833 RepID=A0ABT7HE73_9GAMM|nr:MULTISPECIES: hypothetical protein [unclassified Marinobacter]MBW7469884.1 hypothetical protein [Marinobacter sp. F4218]MDK9557856.1 hypothetical protein [Marinobacter sp. M216]